MAGAVPDSYPNVDPLWDNLIAGAMGMVPLTVLSNRGGSARGSRQVYASASPGDGGTEPGPGSQSDSNKELNAEESVARSSSSPDRRECAWVCPWPDRAELTLSLRKRSRELFRCAP